jgi:single-strand DNA-binding protein
MVVRKSNAPVKKATVKKAAPRKATATTKAPAKSNVRKAAAPASRQSAPTASTTNRNRTQSNRAANIGRVGNIGSDPELRYSPNGTAVCSVSLAYSPYNFETKEQGETVWYRCIGFNQMAEQMANNLSTGMRVIVTGRPQLNEWEDDEGNQHSIKEILVDGIGPDIRFASVSVEQNDRRGPRNGVNPGEYDDEEPF